ncbi:DUF6232 family protein [Streptomyces sp. BI20]|uniref:DUF6232 family protein n=1 Tax=Streptomyces sp. BI20 TaxID=3403460 RepID=UPI003C72E4AB
MSEPPNPHGPIPPRPSGPPTSPGVPIPGTRPASSEPVPADNQLVVRDRLLWVHGAAFPLANIARVHTFVLVPRRGAAVARFLIRLVGVVVVAGLLTSLTGLTNSGSSYGGYESDDSGSGLATFVWIAALAYLGWEANVLVKVLRAKDQHVLAVDTAGPPSAIITFQDRSRRQQLLAQLAYALDHPGTEFTAIIETLNLDMRRYQGSGNNFQFHSGSGNNSVTGGSSGSGR